MKDMQKILSRVRSAVDKYRMIAPGDRIAQLVMMRRIKADALRRAADLIQIDRLEPRRPKPPRWTSS